MDPRAVFNLCISAKVLNMQHLLQPVYNPIQDIRQVTITFMAYKIKVKVYGECRKSSELHKEVRGSSFFCSGTEITGEFHGVWCLDYEFDQFGFAKLINRQLSDKKHDFHVKIFVLICKQKCLCRSCDLISKDELSIGILFIRFCDI